MSESLTKEKQDRIPKDRISPDGENPLYCASYIQTWENYRRMNEELYRQKVRQLAASLFAILTVVGTAFMLAEKLRLFGWISYGVALLFLVAIPLVWRHQLRTQFLSAHIERDKAWAYAFYTDSFKLDSGNTTTVQKYSDLYRIVEGAEYIYLLLEKNHALPVPRDHGERDTLLLRQRKQQDKNKIAPILCRFSVLSGILTAFFGMTAGRLPNQWLLQTWAFALCAAMPVVWMITTVLTGISWNRYSIPSVRKKGGRIALRVLSVLLCSFAILALGFWDFLFLLFRYPVKQNANGTYTEHVDDSYSSFEYYLYEPEGPFFLRFLRPMTDAKDTDPNLSESAWYQRLRSDNRKETEADAAEPADGGTSENPASDNNSDAQHSTNADSEAEKIRNGALKIFDAYFAAKGSTFRENYTAKGNAYFILQESDAAITYLQYDRDSQNGSCGLYVLWKASKTAEGSWSPTDAQMQNTYAYEYRTGALAESGKTNWSDTGSEEYQKLTGEL
ncbi:YcxB family protein [Murdochiella vaginalis]|uniref:YcxB family protein n=1 Tax=Murdochiella vaginalis TaxID=1852373 RepID=UPI0008FEA8AD|nr:YcxB family protein [Murdochiella vaginalis]